ncbi:MAG: hypothetical protein H7Z43_06500 [Clostridia bacterium]|nr:hypothetical protein [Deltaproteobacteria bacterium]
MDKRRQFEVIKALLVRLVQARGGDVNDVETRYVLKNADGTPSQATAIAPFLTGGYT